VSTENTTGRVAVITGASSGIGEATARALAADGHRVALLARRLDRIQALADELGRGAVAIEADVTDRDSILAAAQRVQDDLGGADILVNNAGVMLLGPFGRRALRRLPADDRDQPAGGDHDDSGVPRSAHRRRRR
jgi:NADP-dependent 3-hydroxy acid dehydrogenase YdfG